ncbi:MAG: hypothetical protein H8E17_19275 [Deltaproteobacteria bacterium]|nr:hypothetical protein [Deltaproteobacteria bacterium]
MNVSKKRKLLVAQLNESLSDLDRALDSLEYSHRKCIALGKKSEYDLDEQESFEALTSRFARTADILTQKTLKTLFAILQEDIKTRIDAANFAEKIGIIKNADTLLNIRELRNQIAHEYVRQNLNVLFVDVLHYVPELKMVVLNLKKYALRFSK